MTNAERIVNRLLEAEEQTEFPFGLPSSEQLSRLIHASEMRLRAEMEKAHGKQIKDFSFSRHGVQNCSFWQGAGTSFTDWDEAITGTGDNAHSAAQEALDEAAQSGWDIRGIENPYDPDSTDTVENAVREHNPEAVGEDGEVDTEDMYYYVVLYIEGEPPMGEWTPDMAKAEEEVEEALQQEFPINDPLRLTNQDTELAAGIIDRALARELEPGNEAIRGTAIPQDIIEASLAMLKDVHELGYEEFVAAHEEEMVLLKYSQQDDTELYEFMDKVFAKLDEYCPPYTYFGAYEADGAIGCWPSYDDLREGGETEIIGYNDWKPGTEYSFFDASSDRRDRLYRTETKELIWEF